MKTNNIKKYAPQARKAFIGAVMKKINELGIYSETQISDATEQGTWLVVEGRNFDIKIKRLRERLIDRIQNSGFLVLVEHIAYTWFNRLSAIRFMELHGYLDHGLRVLSHPDNNNGFEILDHAQDVAEDLGLKRDQVIELKLAGNQDELLYRTLLLGQCHVLHKAMPFLFEAIDDETELLLPDNLTRTDSILRGLVNDIPEEDWEQVEIIGWLYQFYISEKKDEVIGKVVKSEDIPAATQLFTPNWIVKYLVQNSVGRQWLQTYPDSKLVENLKEADRKKKIEAAKRRGESNTDNIEGDVYYIEPAEQTDAVNTQLKAITPDSIDPESIKVLDPACGSGHILVEAYQVLKAIYKERGFRDRDIPKLILENNLFGLDIDDRAAQLAGFALMMMAREDDRRIFTRDVQLNVIAMQSTAGFSLQNEDCLVIQDEQQRLEFVRIVQDLLILFEQAKTFGSLIAVPEYIADYLPKAESIVKQFSESGDLFAQNLALTLMPIIKQTETLARKYDAVVANPPYMGGKGMNADLKKFAKDHYPNAKSDLFAIFMEHGFSLLKENGFNAQINMQTWMFLSSYEKLREWLLETKTFITMAHLGARAFSQISGEVVQTTAWVLSKNHVEYYQPVFFRLIEGNEEEKRETLLKQEKCFDSTQQDDFKKISGSPIAYWVSDNWFSVFDKFSSVGSESFASEGIKTGNNDKFLRLWSEVDYLSVGTIDKLNVKWVFHHKGGEYRKWAGNQEFLIYWKNDGELIRSMPNSGIQGEPTFFEDSAIWSDITSGGFSARLKPKNHLFDSASPSCFLKSRNFSLLLAFLNSKVVNFLTPIINPTLHFKVGNYRALPFNSLIKAESNSLIKLAQKDWNTYETSWDFKSNPLTVGRVSVSVTQHIEAGHVGLRDKATNPTYMLSNIYADWQTQNQQTIFEMQRLEEENNRLFIDAYGLQVELTPEVTLEQITLTVNPKYRYGTKITDKELESRFQSDTLAELISYAVGCMVGRYSPDQEGLVYAHAGNEGFTELVQQGVYKTFPADDDGIIPLTNQEWFADDATHRFREFVRVVWGEDKLQTNLDFIAESLCLYAIKAKSGETSLDTIRRYLSTKFYKDHLKTYKKRPIYWLFSSGKQKAFECLVYLHRYNESTLSRMRTEYVTPLLGKYEASAMVLQKQMQDASTTAESNRFKNSLTALEKKQNELSEFDDKLKHTADMRISLDLDDGVKVNYGRFGDLLAEVKAVTGKK